MIPSASAHSAAIAPIHRLARSGASPWPAAPITASAPTRHVDQLQIPGPAARLRGVGSHGDAGRIAGHQKQRHALRASRGSPLVAGRDDEVVGRGRIQHDRLAVRTAASRLPRAGRRGGDVGELIASRRLVGGQGELELSGGDRAAAAPAACAGVAAVARSGRRTAPRWSGRARAASPRPTCFHDDHDIDAVAAQAAELPPAAAAPASPARAYCAQACGGVPSARSAPARGAARSRSRER